MFTVKINHGPDVDIYECNTTVSIITGDELKGYIKECDDMSAKTPTGRISHKDMQAVVHHDSVTSYLYAGDGVKVQNRKGKVIHSHTFH